MSGDDRPAAIEPAGAVAVDSDNTPRCGRWKLKPFELLRPLLLRPDGPLTLEQFLQAPDPGVLDDLNRLEPEELQELALARLRGAPPESRLSLFGQPGYTIRDVVRHVEEGTPLGVRIIDAERKLVGLLVTEALRPTP